MNTSVSVSLTRRSPRQGHAVLFSLSTNQRQKRSNTYWVLTTCQALCQTFFKIYFIKASFTYSKMHTFSAYSLVNLTNVYTQVTTPQNQDMETFLSPKDSSLQSIPTPTLAPGYHWFDFSHYWLDFSLQVLQTESYCTQSFVSGSFFSV